MNKVYMGLLLNVVHGDGQGSHAFVSSIQVKIIRLRWDGMLF